jgi:hypothetical protein
MSWLTDLKDRLTAIYNAVGLLGGVAVYQEQIPEVDFELSAIDDTLTSPPPAADAENSIVDIDEIAQSTFALRSLVVNVTSFGTGTKLTFKLWAMVNDVVTAVDTVDISVLGIYNLMDLFGLPEVHSDGIWVTVVTDAGATGACSGTWKYAKATEPVM